MNIPCHGSPLLVLTYSSKSVGNRYVGIKEDDSNENIEESGEQSSDSDTGNIDEFEDNDGNSSAHVDNNVDENMVADKSVKSKDGTTWTIISDGEQTGRFQNQNVFTAKSGTTPYSRTASTPL